MLSAITIASDLGLSGQQLYTYTAPFTAHEIMMIIDAVIGILLFTAGLAVLLVGLFIMKNPKQQETVDQAPMSTQAPMQAQEQGVQPDVSPVREWYVAQNDAAAGPYLLVELQQMAASGQIVTGTWIWGSNMTSWTEARNLADLAPYLRA